MAQKAETRFSDLVRQDLTKLERIGRLWFTKIQQASIRGVPDYLLCANGLFIALELKRAEGIEPDALQTYNLRKINMVGGVSYCATPENWDGILIEIERLTRIGAQKTRHGNTRTKL